MGEDLTMLDQIRGTAIAGVYIHPLKEIPAVGGPVLRLWRCGQEETFREIYFSEINPGFIKAWKRHKRQSQNLAAPWGLIRLVVFDPRKDSPSFGKMEQFLLGRPDHYNLLHVPPGLWYGFEALDEPALLCNLADMHHDPLEAEKVDPESPLAPCAWPAGK